MKKSPSMQGRKNKPNRKKQKSRIIIVCMLILLTLIAGIICLYRAELDRIEKERIEAERIAEEQRIQERKEKYEHIMQYDILPDGITVNNIDVGGKTLHEAISYLRDTLDIESPEGSVSFTYGQQIFTFDLSGIIVTDNISEVLLDALSDIRSDDMEHTLMLVDFIAQNGKNYNVTYSVNTDAVNLFVENVADQVEVPVKNAGIDKIDTENYLVLTTTSSSGITVDKTKMIELILENNGLEENRSYQLPTLEIVPTVTEELIKLIEVSATTSFKGSSSNRIYNIKKGAGMINGTILHPGETFSCNDTLGVRTLKNGWREANAYVSGTTEVQAGGGVCQLSSTLYNAVVKANLKVVFRQNHSMPVSYIDKGLDATINSVGNMIDFKFKNNTASDIVVFAWTEEKKLYFKIVRCAFETDEFDEIKLSSKKVETIEPSGPMTVTVDNTLAPGEEVIDVATQNGSIYKSYKNYYKDGELVRTEKLDESTYKAYNGSKRVGPGVSIKTESAKKSNSSGIVIAELEE